jgi:hypothetical protein
MKNILNFLSNQFYYYNGTMRLVYPELFDSEEIVLAVSKEEADFFKNAVDNQNLELTDFNPYREESQFVNEMFQMVQLNQMFQQQDGRFNLSTKGGQIFLSVDGFQIPNPLPNGLWNVILDAITKDNERDVLSYIRFFANVQRNEFKHVRNNVMPFLQKVGSEFCITEWGTMIAFKQLNFHSSGNQIVRDAIKLKPIVQNKIKKSYSAVNMFYLNGEAQLTEGSFELIGNHYDAANTVQWIGTMQYALSLDPNLDTYTDGWTKKMRIVEGLKVIEPRQHVNNDPNKTCVKGLHIYPLNWKNDTFYGSGKSVFAIEVNPIDICAIPNAYNYSKSRAASYTVYQQLEMDYNEIQIPEYISNGILYGDKGLVDVNVDPAEFPAIEHDIAEIVIPEHVCSPRFEINWDDEEDWDDYDEEDDYDDYEEDDAYDYDDY